MTHSTHDPISMRHLTRLAQKLRDDAGYMANVLAAYQQQERLTEDALARRLSLDSSQLPRLALCKRPQTQDIHFAEQVRQISSFTGADATALAQIVRQVEAVQEFRHMPRSENTETADSAVTSPLPGLMAAARDLQDAEDDSIPKDEKPDDEEKS